MGANMKKLLLTLVLILILNFQVFASSPQYNPEDYPVITWEQAGSNYIILEEGEDYTIIIVDGKICVVYE